MDERVTRPEAGTILLTLSSRKGSDRVRLGAWREEDNLGGKGIWSGKTRGPQIDFKEGERIIATVTLYLHGQPLDRQL